jgi:cytochrome c-type biogenesis protein CcmF
MIPTIGHLAVVIGLAATLYALGAFVIAGRRGDRAVEASARRAMLVAFGLAALASGAMIISLLTHDFSVAYVVRNNATTTPPFYSVI